MVSFHLTSAILFGEILYAKLYRKIEFFYTGVIKTEANPQTLLHTSFNCYECPIFKECN